MKNFSLDEGNVKDEWEFSPNSFKKQAVSRKRSGGYIKGKGKGKEKNRG